MTRATVSVLAALGLLGCTGWAARVPDLHAVLAVLSLAGACSTTLVLAGVRTGRADTALRLAAFLTLGLAFALEGAVAQEHGTHDLSLMLFLPQRPGAWLLLSGFAVLAALPLVHALFGAVAGLPRLVLALLGSAPGALVLSRQLDGTTALLPALALVAGVLLALAGVEFGQATLAAGTARAGGPLVRIAQAPGQATGAAARRAGAWLWALLAFRPRHSLGRAVLVLLLGLSVMLVVAGL